MAKKQKTKKPQVSAAKVAVESSYDRWITWVCYAILVILPLAISRISYDQFDLVKLAILRVLVLALVFIWLAKLLAKGQPISWSRRELLLVIFLVWALISTLTSIHIPTALHGKYKRYEGLLTFFTYFTMYFVAYQTFTTKKRIQTLVEIISVTGGVVALYGILQYIGADPIYWGNVPFEERRSFSTFGNPDLLAGYLVLAFPCSIVAFLDDSKRRWLHGISVFALSSGLLTAFTRSGWLGALAGLIVLTVLLGRRLRPYWRQLAAVGAAFVIVLAAMIIYSSTQSLNIVAKFEGAFRLDSGTALGRFEIWKAGLKMMADRPLFGQGLDTYRLASEHFETKRYVQSVTGTTVSDNAHNYPIQVGAGAGPLAALFFYGFFIVWLVRMIRVRKNLGTDSEVLMITGGVAAVIGYLATMMLGISIVGASSTFWLIMGSMAGYVRKAAPEDRIFSTAGVSQELKLIGALVMVVLTVISAGLAVSMYIGDTYLVKGLVATSGNPAEAPANFQKAASLYPGNGRIMSELGQVYLRWAQDAVTRKDDNGFKTYISKAVESFEAAVASEYIEVDYQVFLANSYGYGGDYGKAVDLLDKVLARRPYSVPGHYLYAQFKDRMNQKPEAIAHYELVYELAGTYMNVNTELARLYKEVGDNAKAAKFEKLGQPQGGQP